MSAPRLTVRIQLQQDHGFSRPLFRKPRRRRWPWLLLMLLIGGGVALYLNPEALRQLPSTLPTAHTSTPLATPVVVATSASPSTSGQVESSAGTHSATALQPAPALVEEDATPEAPAATALMPAPQPDGSAPAASVVAASAEQGQATALEPSSPRVETAAERAATAQAPSSEQIAAAVGAQPTVEADQTGHHVTRALLAANIAEREPVAVIDTNRPLQLGTPTALYYFTELRDLNGSRVVHRWYHNGTMVKERAIDVGAIRWRTWSRHVLDDLSGGDWKVVLVDSQGAVLAESHWQVAAPAVTPTP